MSEVSEKVVNEAKNEQKFSKEQIIKSVKYMHKRDLIDALLDNDKNYTMETVDKMIEKYMKGQVN